MSVAMVHAFTEPLLCLSPDQRINMISCDASFKDIYLKTMLNLIIFTTVFLQSFKSTYLKLLVSEIPAFAVTPEEYLKKNSQPTEWGGHMELAAFYQISNMGINVVYLRHKFHFFKIKFSFLNFLPIEKSGAYNNVYDCKLKKWTAIHSGDDQPKNSTVPEESILLQLENKHYQLVKTIIPIEMVNH